MGTSPGEEIEVCRDMGNYAEKRRQATNRTGSLTSWRGEMCGSEIIGSIRDRTLCTDHSGMAWDVKKCLVSIGNIHLRQNKKDI